MPGLHSYNMKTKGSPVSRVHLNQSMTNEMTRGGTQQYFGSF